MITSKNDIFEKAIEIIPNALNFISISIKEALEAYQRMKNTSIKQLNEQDKKMYFELVESYYELISYMIKTSSNILRQIGDNFENRSLEKLKIIASKIEEIQPEIEPMFKYVFKLHENLEKFAKILEEYNEKSNNVNKSIISALTSTSLVEICLQYLIIAITPIAWIVKESVTLDNIITSSIFLENILNNDKKNIYIDKFIDNVEQMQKKLREIIEMQNKNSQNFYLIEHKEEIVISLKKFRNFVEELQRIAIQIL